ncbi:hypothetical protein LCGC14_2891270 [marine sediment metagenome]|uniref:Uncharacterized protein n=1 Tax=marine sediment metagenome TaxID=412755 RepID=A0A0F8YIY4_9ZZZZ
MVSYFVGTMRKNTGRPSNVYSITKHRHYTLDTKRSYPEIGTPKTPRDATACRAYHRGVTRRTPKRRRNCGKFWR